MKTFSALMFSWVLGACASPPAPPPPPPYPGVTSPIRGGESPAEHALINGTVSFDAQSSPPLGAKLTLFLEDVTRTDRAAELLSMASFVLSTAPSKFDIAYDPSMIKANRRYVVRANVTRDDAVLFVSDKSYPVFGSANITRVNILMRRTSPAVIPASETTAQLENTFWKLRTLGNDEVASPAGAREIHFVLQGEGHRVHGFAGCNGMMGSYTLTAARLTFSRMGGTMMACANGMEQEQKFHQMFAHVEAWKLDGETLQLLDGAGSVLATFAK